MSNLIEKKDNQFNKEQMENYLENKLSNKNKSNKNNYKNTFCDNKNQNETYEYDDDNKKEEDILFYKTNGRNFRDNFKDQVNYDKSFFRITDRYNNFKNEKIKNFHSKPKENKKTFPIFQSVTNIDNSK